MLVLIFSLTPKGQQESHRIIEYTFASLGGLARLEFVTIFRTICWEFQEFHIVHVFFLVGGHTKSLKIRHRDTTQRKLGYDLAHPGCQDGGDSFFFSFL